MAKIYVIKVFPTSEKVLGTERIAYVFSPECGDPEWASDDDQEWFENDAISDLFAHNDEIGFTCSKEEALEIRKNEGFYELNYYMDKAVIECYSTNGGWIEHPDRVFSGASWEKYLNAMRKYMKNKE